MRATATKNKAAKIIGSGNRKTDSGLKDKDFDSAKTMRTIRDRLSKEIMNMTFEEEDAYLQKLLSSKKS